MTGCTRLVSTLPSFAAYYVTSTKMAMAMLWIFIPSVYLYIGHTLALGQNLVPATMRSATALCVVGCNPSTR